MAVAKSLVCGFLLFLAILAVSCDEVNARSIKAYFNGQEATVENVSLHVGEPFTVDLYMTPDGDSFAYAILTEPGYTRAYDRISGEAVGDTVTKKCNESSPAHFSWTLAANDQWVNGTAPVNVYCQLNRKGDTSPYARAYFTVVDARILPADRTIEKSHAPASAEGLPAWIVLVTLASITLLKRKKG
ncbi:sarcinarray family MAST domain-containing protein [Methanocella sp. MCL-LM]|uniref:sarcinarray family MAST domain-containing protein n=1 Tax=Methanocella sp. MCL-LM TaxID=3412035 RepID=UPI003C77E4DF